MTSSGVGLTCINLFTWFVLKFQLICISCLCNAKHEINQRVLSLPSAGWQLHSSHYSNCRWKGQTKEGWASSSKQVFMQMADQCSSGRKTAQWPTSEICIFEERPPCFSHVCVFKHLLQWCSPWRGKRFLPGILYFQNTTRFYFTWVNVISFTPIRKPQAFLFRFSRN